MQVHYKDQAITVYYNSVYYENYMKHIRTLRGKMKSFLMAQQVVHIVTTELQTVRIFNQDTAWKNEVS